MTVLALAWALLSLTTAGSQSPAVIAAPPLPPATRLEAFAPPPGSLVTIGYDRLGGVEGVFVEVREMHDERGGSASGLVVAVSDDQAHSRQESFVDADEIAGLVKGVDALLEVNRNPTNFDNYEVHYATRGELMLSALSTRAGGVVYGIEAGRLMKARREGLTSGEMVKLRGLFDAAAQKLRTALAAR